MGFSKFSFKSRQTVSDIPIVHGNGSRRFVNGGFTGDRRARKNARGELEVRADLVIGADGRHSTIHTRAGLEQREFGVPIDVLWMRISKKQGDPKQTFGFFQHGKLVVLLDRDDYWQCGFVIPKGAFDEIKARGLTQFQNDIVSFAGFLRDRVAETGRLVEDQTAHRASESPARLVLRRIALHR